VGEDFLLSVGDREVFGVNGGKSGRADTDDLFFRCLDDGGDFFHGLFGLSGGILGRTDNDCGFFLRIVPRGLFGVVQRVGIWGGFEEHISGDLVLVVVVPTLLLLVIFLLWLLSLCFRLGDLIDESLDLRGCFITFFFENEEGVGGGDFVIFLSALFILILFLTSPSSSLLSPSDKKERLASCSWRWDTPRAK